MVLQTNNIRHSFNKINTLSFPDIKIESKENLLILGDSGSGKTTLLNIIAGLLKPSEGDIFIKNIDLYKLKGNALDYFRGNNIGIVFQKLQLIKSLNVKDNLLVANYLAGKQVETKLAKELLTRLGIEKKMNEKIGSLSVGQQQRVAIARAMMNKPSLLIADEPTSSLDDKNCDIVINLLLDEAKNNDSSLLITTHDHRIKKYFENKINIEN